MEALLAAAKKDPLLALAQQRPVIPKAAPQGKRSLVEDPLLAAAMKRTRALAPALTPAPALQQQKTSLETTAEMQNAWATSALRTSNAAAELRKLMGAAKKIKVSAASSAEGGSSSSAASPPQVPAAFASGKKITAITSTLTPVPADGGLGLGLGLDGAGDSAAATAAAAAAAAATNFDFASMAQVHQQLQQQQQQLDSFDIEEMQRVQFAMQMQMEAAAKLQQVEETLKRDIPSPPRDTGRNPRKKPMKEATEFFYDMDKAEQQADDPVGVATNDLVKKVKLIKRSSARGFNAWESFVTSKGNKTKDPRLHHDEFLNGFLQAVGRGDYGVIPGATAILGSQAERFVPEQPQGDGSERPYPRAVFICGLPKETNEKDLRDHMESFGKVEAVRLKYDSEGLFRGIGEVEFVLEGDAKKVIDNYDYNIFQNRWINCMMAKRKGHLGRNPKWWTSK